LHFNLSIIAIRGIDMIMICILNLNNSIIYGKIEK